MLRKKEGEVIIGSKFRSTRVGTALSAAKKKKYLNSNYEKINIRIRKKTEIKLRTIVIEMNS